MRPTAYTIITVLALAIFGAHAEDTPERDRVITCFDNNLATLIRSNESIEVVFKAVRTVCDDAIDNALNQTFANITASKSGPKTPLEIAGMVSFFNKRVDAALFAYAVKFKDLGGPTTLQF